MADDKPKDRSTAPPPVPDERDENSVMSAMMDGSARDLDRRDPDLEKYQVIPTINVVDGNGTLGAPATDVRVASEAVGYFSSHPHGDRLLADFEYTDRPLAGVINRVVYLNDPDREDSFRYEGVDAAGTLSRDWRGAQELHVDALTEKAAYESRVETERGELEREVAKARGKHNFKLGASIAGLVVGAIMATYSWTTNQIISTERDETSAAYMVIKGENIYTARANKEAKEKMLELKGEVIERESRAREVGRIEGKLAEKITSHMKKYELLVEDLGEFVVSATEAFSFYDAVTPEVIRTIEAQEPRMREAGAVAQRVLAVEANVGERTQAIAKRYTGLTSKLARLGRLEARDRRIMLDLTRKLIAHESGIVDTKLVTEAYMIEPVAGEEELLKTLGKSVGLHLLRGERPKGKNVVYDGTSGILIPAGDGDVDCSWAVSGLWHELNLRSSLPTWKDVSRFRGDREMQKTLSKMLAGRRKHKGKAVRKKLVERVGPEVAIVDGMCRFENTLAGDE